MFKFSCKKGVIAFLILLLCGLGIPSVGARADLRMGPERSGTYNMDDGRLSDEYGRVDFTVESTAKVKSQDMIYENDGENAVYTVVENKNWRITLESGKYNYAADEPIDVKASLEYIGKGDSKEIKICDPILGFYLESSTGTYICQYAAYSTSDPYPPKTFVKGKKYEVKLDFHKCDTANAEEYDEDRMYGRFHDDKGNFILPKGSYTVKAGMTDKASKRSTKGRQTDFFATLHFNVDTEGRIFTVGNDLFRTLGEDEAVLIGNKTDAVLSYGGQIEGEAWIIPSEVEFEGSKRKVTVIGDEGIKEYAIRDIDDNTYFYVSYSAFEGKTFSSIVIPSSVKKISSHALSGLHGMNEVKITAKNIEIGEGAFSNCSWGIEEGKKGRLRIDADTVKLGNNAFSNCYLLQDIKIKASESLIIGDDAFDGCYNLLKVKLPQTTEYIGDRAFYDCGMDKKLTIRIPAGVTYIGESVVTRANLKLDDNNTAYKLENGLIMTADGQTVVRVASRNQKEIVVPEGVTRILPGAFEKCRAESLTLPDSLTEVPANMMKGDIKLTKVKLGEGITAIGDYAFYDTSIKTVTVPASVKTIGKLAFANGRKLKKVVLHQGLESIGDHAFWYCNKLKGLVIPNTVSSVGKNIAGINYNYPDFSITFEEGNPYYEQAGNEVFTPGTGKLVYLITYPSSREDSGTEEDTGTEYWHDAPQLTERVESIEKLGYTFTGFSDALTLPKTLKSMDIAFLPGIMDYEEGGVLVFTGSEPPKITNNYDTSAWFSLLAVIPGYADKEAYEKAFTEAGLSDNQRVYIKKEGE